MSNLTWTNEGWGEYLYWQMQDRKTLKCINLLIKDILRSPFDGIGNPEPLKDNLSGFWSRRIDEKNRIIYYVRDTETIIARCKTHYE